MILSFYCVILQKYITVHPYVLELHLQCVLDAGFI